MQIVNGLVQFDEPSEKAVWESTLQRPINEIPPDLLRQLGEARVKELIEEGYEMWARMVAHDVSTIPQSNLH